MRASEQLIERTHMDITITPKQFMELKRINIAFSIDTRDETMDLRNLPLQLEACWKILGRQTVSDALASGAEIKVRVDWSKG